MNEEKTAAEDGDEAATSRDMSGEQAQKILAKFDELIASQRSEKRMKNLEEANAKLSEDHAYLSLAHTALTIDDARFKSEAMRREQGLRDHGAALQANLEKTIAAKDAFAEKARALDAKLAMAKSEIARWLTLTGTLALKLVPVVGTFAQTSEGLMHFLDALAADVLRMSEKLTGHSRTIVDRDEENAILRADLAEKTRLYDAAQEDLKLLKPLLDDRQSLARVIAYSAEGPGSSQGLQLIRDFLKATEVPA